MKSTNRKKPTKNKEEVALNFFAEAGLLKHVKRSGWWVAGIKDPESVAEHCYRCAVIGYYLAHMEKADAFKVLTMTLFNDIHEARINDLHKMGHFYIDFRDAESKAFKDQIKDVPASMKKELSAFREEYDGQASKESLVARDADILECLVQAKEYSDRGHVVARKFLKRAPDHLKTASAKKLWTKLKSWDSTTWWEHVVKFDR